MLQGLHTSLDILQRGVLIALVTLVACYFLAHRARKIDLPVAPSYE